MKKNKIKKEIDKYNEDQTKQKNKKEEEKKEREEAINFLKSIKWWFNRK